MNNVWEKCKITNKEFSTARGFLNHLRGLKMSSKEYYDMFHKVDNGGICYCGNKTTYHAFSYNRYCSDICACKSINHRMRVSTRFERNPSTLDSFRINRKEAVSNIDWPAVKILRRITMQHKVDKLGITLSEYYSNLGKKTYLSMSPEQINSAKIKGMATKQKNGIFGGRSGYKPYPFFNDYVALQGYEPIILDELVKCGLDQDDIIVGKSMIPVISYGNNRRYFPDIYLPKLNLLIEVKSTYTLAQHYDNVMVKCKASIQAGYSLLLIVLSKHEARNRKLDGLSLIHI
jgi:hypothetical protein